MRLEYKIKEIEMFLSELEGFMPKSLEEYKKDHKTKAACERYFERIVESIVDLSLIIIKDNGFEIPEEENQCFQILAKQGILSTKLAQRLREAKGMRNIIAHQYGTVDDELVFNSITEEIVKDAEDFLEAIQIKHSK